MTISSDCMDQAASAPDQTYTVVITSDTPVSKPRNKRKRLPMTLRTKPVARTASLLTIWAATACLAAQTPGTGLYTRHYENVLGTSLEMKLRAPNAATEKRAEAATLAEIDRENAILSAWQPTSEFSRWIKTRNTPVHVSPELLDVLALFDGWRQQTGGALDASAETAVRVWKAAEAEHRQPTADELAAAVHAMQQPHWKL